MTRRRAHYVLSTHWDREWYQTFQDYRYRLVDLLGRVFDGLESQNLRGPFQMDGQSIPLEDYLEVCPEQHGRVENLVKSRRLIVGPWYVLPDEFLVSGESLIRNLRLGRCIARRFGGEPSNAGFVCDLFGHIGQLPQIFAGFGIHGALVWRGTNLIETRNLIWEGVDGTQLICFRFGLHGYCGFAISVRHADEPRRNSDRNGIRGDLDAMLAHEAEATQVDPLLIFDGGDHQAWDEQVYQVLAERMTQADARDTFELVHSDLDQYLEELVDQSSRITHVWRGEMREPACHPEQVDNQWLIPGVGSSRVWIKQANAACQTLLTAWAEPFTNLAALALGAETRQGFLDCAWRWLLQNHPHDSICGCSIDAVHEDMKYRFAQSQQIAERLTTESLRHIAAAVQDEIPADSLRVCVFNPSCRPFDGVAEIDLSVPTTWPGLSEHISAAVSDVEHKPLFTIQTATGDGVAYQVVEQRLNRRKIRIRPTKFPESRHVHDVRIAAALRVPAMGYTTLYVGRGDRAAPRHQRHQPGMATSERSMANERLSVTIESNGTLTITDKQSDECYTRLLTFDDVADIGDGWYHGQPVNDQCVVSTACSADVVLLHDGPLLTSFMIRTNMRIPAAFNDVTGQRSDAWREMLIRSTVTLRHDAEHLEVTTTIDNPCDDHRVRVLLPSGAQAQTYLADGAFDVIERPIALRANRHLHREPELETRPQQTWTAVHDTQRGLAVISEGLHESAVRDLPERPIALTLFRSTRRTVFTDGEPNGQLHGPMTFRYWIKPLRGEPDRAALFQLGQHLSAGFRSVQVTEEDRAPDHQSEAMPVSTGWFAVEGPAVMTSAARAGNATEVRLFNPTESTIAVKLHFNDCPPAWRPVDARCVDFESRLVDGVITRQANGSMTFSLERKKIVTVQLQHGRRNHP